MVYRPRLLFATCVTCLNIASSLTAGVALGVGSPALYQEREGQSMALFLAANPPVEQRVSQAAAPDAPPAAEASPNPDPASPAPTDALTGESDWLWLLAGILVPVLVVGVVLYSLRRTSPLGQKPIAPAQKPSPLSILSADGEEEESGTVASLEGDDVSDWEAAPPTRLGLEKLNGKTATSALHARGRSPHSFSLLDDEPLEPEVLEDMRVFDHVKADLNADLDADLPSSYATEQSDPLPPPADRRRSKRSANKATPPSPQPPPIAETTRLPQVDIVLELIDDLHNPDPTKRRKAIWELGQRGDSRAMQPLVDLMTDSDSSQRSLILAAISEICIRTLKPVNRALLLSIQDDSSDVRKNGIRDVTRIYDLVAQTSQLLQHSLGDGNEEVRDTARWALTQLNRIRSLPTLEGMTSLPNGTSNHSHHSPIERLTGDPPRGTN